MKKIFKLLLPAIVAVALFASCEDPMDEMLVKENTSVENTNKESALPPKDQLRVPRW